MSPYGSSRTFLGSFFWDSVWIHGVQAALKCRSNKNKECEAPKTIAKLVNITPITMVYGTQITIVTGANLNQLTSLGGLTLKEWYPNYFLVDPDTLMVDFQLVISLRPVGSHVVH